MTAADALEKLQRYAPEVDLLLTDVVLPEQSGVTLYEKALEFSAHLPVIFMSGYSGETLERHGAAEEEHQLLQKPFSPTALLHRVADMLD
jgi:CheY-like chemotaxis protein